MQPIDITKYSDWRTFFQSIKDLEQYEDDFEVDEISEDMIPEVDSPTELSIIPEEIVNPDG